jgi:hypothetical protein
MERPDRSEAKEEEEEEGGGAKGRQNGPQQEEHGEEEEEGKGATEGKGGNVGNGGNGGNGEKRDKLESTFSLVPLYSYTSKCVTIDTDALHALLGGKTGTGMTLQDFASKQNLQWPKIFKIPAPLLVLGDGPKKAFDYTIKTNGVRASVTYCKWVSKSLQVKGETCKRAYEDMPRDPVYVGIDPGGRILVATAREGSARSGYSLSNKQYYHECKMNERKLLKDKHLREAGLTDWLTATPSPKTSRSTRMMEHLAYLLGPSLYT